MPYHLAAARHIARYNRPSARGSFQQRLGQTLVQRSQRSYVRVSPDLPNVVAMPEPFDTALGSVAFECQFVEGRRVPRVGAADEEKPMFNVTFPEQSAGLNDGADALGAEHS